MIPGILYYQLRCKRNGSKCYEIMNHIHEIECDYMIQNEWVLPYCGYTHSVQATHIRYTKKNMEQ
jgi:hypothetical protein